MKSQENASICDEVSRVQSHICKIKEERKFLLKKLMQHEGKDLICERPIKKEIKRKNSDANSETSNISKTIIVKKQKIQPPQPSLLKKQIQFQPKDQKITYFNPSCPFVVDGITVLNLGEIIWDRPSYHTETCIYPMNYSVTRILKNCLYTCRIINNGEFPIFEIFSNSDSQRRFTASSTDYCHAEMLQAIENRNEKTINSIIIPDGDNFFGLTNKNIIKYLQQLPNAKKLHKLKQIKREQSFLIDDTSTTSFSHLPYVTMSSSVPEQLF